MCDFSEQEQMIIISDFLASLASARCQYYTIYDDTVVANEQSFGYEEAEAQAKFETPDDFEAKSKPVGSAADEETAGKSKIVGSGAGDEMIAKSKSVAPADGEVMAAKSESVSSAFDDEMCAEPKEYPALAERCEDRSRSAGLEIKTEQAAVENLKASKAEEDPSKNLDQFTAGEEVASSEPPWDEFHKLFLALPRYGPPVISSAEVT